MSGFYATMHDDAPVELTIAPGAIRHSAAPASFAPASSVVSSKTAHRFGSLSQNSRSPHVFRDAAVWRVAWQVPVDSSLSALAVLTAEDRLLAYGWTGWQLISTDGHPVNSGGLDTSDVLVDGASGYFYLVDSSSSLVARRLSDGEKAFGLPGPGALYQVPYMGFLRDRLALVAIARPQDPHGGYHPNRSLIQTHDIGPPGRLVNELKRETLAVSAAIREPGLVVAVPDWIYFLDPDLTIRGALEGAFQPLSLSLDEAGRVYLLVQEHKRIALWVVAPNGERLFSVLLPEGLRAGAVPPVVSYDHHIFVLGTGRLMTFDSAGKLSSELPTTGQLNGAMVSANNVLLFGRGRQLTALYPDLTQRNIIQLPETVSSPPALLPSGDLVVAGSHHMYRLTPTGAP